MSVVGIDLGYQSCYVAIAKHGGVETVINEYSERSSPSLVAYTPTQRLMGTSAKTQVGTNFANTVNGIKLLLGRKYTDPVVQDELSKNFYKAQQLANDVMGVTVQYLNEEHTFTSEQVTATMLTYLKSIAEKGLGKPVADCVISVPSYFTDAQRRALLDASSIAGLNCLRLINETTSVALAYGIYKQDLPEEKEKARNVVFVDMGCHSLQVTICAFNKGKLKVLSKAFDPSLGGRDFDRRLVHHFAAEFKEKFKVDALSRPRQTLRLGTECEKLKKLMSANATAIPINIECFMNDKDVSGRMKRQQFQDLCQDLLDRVKRPLEEALYKSGLKLNDIYSVEIVGGSTRIPAVKEIISSVFQRELSTTLNTDEAVARGCALQCAILSPTFKVRDFSITDTQPYPIQLNWQVNGELGDMIVYKEGDSIYHSKILTFYRNEPFDLFAKYQFPDQIPYPDPNIGKFTIKNVTPNEEGESSKVKVKVRMSIHGTFFIKEATLVKKQPPVETMETETPATSTAPDSTDTPINSNATPTDDTTPPEAADITDKTDGDTEPTSTVENDSNAAEDNSGDKMEVESQPSTDKVSDDTQAPADKPTNSQGATPKQPEKKKKTYMHIDLPISQQTSSLPKKSIEKGFESECKMIQQDKLQIDRHNAKNSLEEYVYDMRDKIENSLQQYISDENREAFMSLLTATEEWLYDEGEDETKSVYDERLAELRKHGDPVCDRQKEHSLRDDTFNALATAIVHYEKIVADYNGGGETYNHIAKEDMEKVVEATQRRREWMEKNMQAQSGLALSVDPAVKVSEIRAAIDNLNGSCYSIVTKAKPKVEPPPDEEAKGEETKMEEATENHTQDEKTTSADTSDQPVDTSDQPVDTSDQPVDKVVEDMDVD